MNKLRFLFRCVISIALIAFVLHKVNFAELGRDLSRIDWRLALLASLLAPLMIASLAFRWRIFLRQQGIVLPYGTVFSLTWAGQFFNSCLPGSTGGDVVKIYQLCRLAPDRKARAAASVIVDRFSALVALAVLTVGALAIDPAPLGKIEELAGSAKYKLIILVSAVLAAAVAALILYHLVRSTHWHGRLQRMYAALKTSLVISPALFAAMAISFGIHCLNFFIAFLFARALGIGITYSQILLIFPVVLLLVMFPVSVNGLGVREVLFTFYFNHLHIAFAGNTDANVANTVVALSAVLFSNDLLWSLPGGLWYVLRFKRVSPVLAKESSA